MEFNSANIYQVPTTTDTMLDTEEAEMTAIPAAQRLHSSGKCVQIII